MNSEEAVRLSVGYLSSRAAQDSIRRDPYWPKWDSPWWHMTLLWEMGLAGSIPRSAVEAMLKALRAHYLRFFPIRIEELPAGADPYRHVACHCCLGTMYQVLSACGAAVDEEVPWIRPWFLKYQLPDGGFNCDEAAYTKPVPKSSVVSTLPPLEAVLCCTKRPFTPQEEAFLDRGAQYLLSHRLCRRLGDGSLIDPAWLLPCFPRFYEYDVLRGLRFLTCWAAARKKPVPREAVEESMAAIRRSRTADGVVSGRSPWSTAKTLARSDDGSWVRGRPASSFPLLREVGRTGLPSPCLTAEWERLGM